MMSTSVKKRTRLPTEPEQLYSEQRAEQDYLEFEDPEQEEIDFAKHADSKTRSLPRNYIDRGQLQLKIQANKERRVEILVAGAKLQTELAALDRVIEEKEGKYNEDQAEQDRRNQFKNEQEDRQHMEKMAQVTYLLNKLKGGVSKPLAEQDNNGNVDEDVDEEPPIRRKKRATIEEVDDKLALLRLLEKQEREEREKQEKRKEKKALKKQEEEEVKKEKVKKEREEKEQEEEKERQNREKRDKEEKENEQEAKKGVLSTLVDFLSFSPRESEEERARKFARLAYFKKSNAATWFKPTKEEAAALLEIKAHPQWLTAPMTPEEGEALVLFIRQHSS